MAAAKNTYPPLTDEQRERLQQHYRSGAAGPELRELQAMVDRGEVTWDAIESGSADPELTERYYLAMGQGATLLRAAAEGQDINEYLPSEDDGPADEDFSRRTWLS